MARLWSSGFELNSTTTNMEFTALSASIVSTGQRSGTYAFSKDATGNRYVTYDFSATDSQGNYYSRMYVYLTAYPAANNKDLMGFTRISSSGKVMIRMLTTGALQLYNIEDAAQVGSDSAALSLNTWYRIELRVDTTTLASTVVDARIDGVSFASSTINLTAGIGKATFGLFSTTGDTTQRFIADDIAINDNSGSFQNSWPGAGSIVHLTPNAEGDSVMWNNGVSATNWENVDEITPDDSSTVNTTTTLNDIDEYNLTAAPAAIGSTDTINCVQVGLRIGNSATATHGYTPRIKAAASGTVEEGSAITITNSTFVTNASAAPRNYNLTLYDLPGASTTAWTKADLDTTQIGVKHTADASFNAQVSTMWLLVDYAPAASGGGAPSWPVMSNTHFWGPRFG